MYPHQCEQLGITEGEMDLLILLIDKIGPHNTIQYNTIQFATGGPEPVTLRLLVRRLHDIAIQEDITCCHDQLWIKISLVAISVCNKR